MSIQKYLKDVEKNLRSLSTEERTDIIKEIESNIYELQVDKEISEEQIVERLGKPNELAKAYLGNSIIHKKKNPFERICALIGFCSLVGLTGIMVLPVTGILAITFYGCAIVVPIAGIIKLVLSLFGIETSLIMIEIGSFVATPFQVFLSSLIMMVLFWGLGKLFMKMTMAYVKAVVVNAKNIID